MPLDRATISRLRDAAQSALDVVGAAEGVRFTVKGMRYFPTHGTFSMKVEGGTVAEDGTAASKEATDFARYKHRHNLGDVLGKTFRSDGNEYRILGWRARARRSPVLVERTSDGKQYVFPVGAVKVGLSLEEPGAPKSLELGTK